MGTFRRIVDSTTPVTGNGMASIDNGQIALIGRRGRNRREYNRYSVANQMLTRVAARARAFPAGLKPSARLAAGIFWRCPWPSTWRAPQGTMPASTLPTRAEFVSSLMERPPFRRAGTFVTGSVGLGLNGSIAIPRECFVPEPPVVGWYRYLFDMGWRSWAR
jgi:hypothetical protein